MRRPDDQGSAMSTLLWTMVVLALLLVVVDRIGDFAAERVAADQLQSSQGLSSRPEVAITGFPFLNQFVAGRYDHVTARASDVRVGTASNALNLLSVRLDFRTVRTSRDFSRFHARSATAHATLAYADLSRRLGVRVRYDGGGRIEASRQLTVLGRTVRPSISARPIVSRQVLTFAGTRIAGLQDAPPEVTGTLQDIFATDLSLKGLPFDIRVTSLKADRRGLELSLTGKDLSYTGR